MVLPRPARRRRERAPLHAVGESPDYRFTLANERTFLAWVRTSLAMTAAGVAVVQLVPGPALVRHILGSALIVLGGLLAVVSYGHWDRTERAMRLGEELPRSPVPRIVAAVLALASVIGLVLIVLDQAR
jgi:putative membrane protein